MNGHSPCTMVIFGASGDLARRKLVPALYGLDCDGLLDDRFIVVGFARTEKSSDGFRAEMRRAVEEYSSRGLTGEVWSRFAARLHYLTGQYDDPEAMAKIDAFVKGLRSSCPEGTYLFYLALPPDIVKRVLEQMKAGYEASRLMIEKPFGADLESARELNELIRKVFDEKQVYRIDHYLAKETVRNLLVFRFANAIFEPLWSNEHIHNVQITAAETIGVEGRGEYYDGAGVVRDMVQNHVLQVLALVTMEPPVAGDAESVRDRKVEIFKSLGSIGKDDVVFGQYEGYRDEEDVASGSSTPTFAALRLSINNWRWKGVPFYIRSGKCLEQKVTEVNVQFQNIPICVLDREDVCPHVKPNVLTIRIQPDEGIRLRFCVKIPGREDTVGTSDLGFRYADLGVCLENPYEKVLLDCLEGVPTLFWRADGVEAAWRAVAPLLEYERDSSALRIYGAGTWGPRECGELLERDGAVWIWAEAKRRS